MKREELTPLEMKKDTIARDYINVLRSDWMEEQVHREENRLRPDGPYQRDFARIMYSSSFRRLQGKMQLLGIKNDQFFRNRLTHSLEVAQIARSIATTVKYDSTESYIVEAGALAHDLGNPPFGHAGEACLNELFVKEGGFEGNAQTLRILTSVERKRPDFIGLNLTYRTLLSVVKYFKRFDRDAYFEVNNPKKNQKFIYDDDYDLLYKFIKEKGIKIRTIDVQIVDIADEIAYAAHDLEDGLRVKAFTVDEILHDYYSIYGNSNCYKKLEQIVGDAKTNSGFGSERIDSTQYSKLFRQELSSSLINLALRDIDLVDVPPENIDKTGTEQKRELGFNQYGELIHGLKVIVFKCINHNDAVYQYEQQGKRVLKYLNVLYRNDPKHLPPEYRLEEVCPNYRELENSEAEKRQGRLICDYIAGMMDSFAISQYEKYSGKKFRA